MQDTKVAVIDTGSYSTKVGLAGTEVPLTCPTVLYKSSTGAIYVIIETNIGRITHDFLFIF